MRVKDLISALQKMDPEATILIEGSDHSYRKAAAYLGTAMQIGGDFYEDGGGPEGAAGKRINAVVVR